MKSDYQEAKERILEAWHDYRYVTNDYLPDYEYQSSDANDLSVKYSYYDDFGLYELAFVLKETKSITELISESIVGDHCRGRLCTCLRNFEKAFKDQNKDKCLLCFYDSFKELREIIIVLEKAQFST